MKGLETELQSNELGTHKTVKARFRPWTSGKSPENVSRYSLFIWKRPGRNRAPEVKMGRRLMAPRTDRMTRIPSGVASRVTTNHAAKGSVFVKLRNAGNFLKMPTRRRTGCSSQSKNNCLAELWSGSEEGSYLSLIGRCITQL